MRRKAQGGVLARRPRSSVNAMSDASAQGGQPLDDDAPTGGSEATEDQLQADNAVEEDMIDALDPNDPPA